MTPILAAWYVYGLSALFILVCIFMMLVILIQKPKGGGLSGAFGGAGGSASAAFGAKTGDVLTVITVGLFVAFLLCAMGLTWTVRPAHEQYMLEHQTLVEEIEQLPEEAAEQAPAAEGSVEIDPLDAATPTLPGEAAPESTAAEPASAGVTEPQAEPASAGVPDTAPEPESP